MSPNDVVTFFQNLVDDSPDQTMVDVLMDTAYTKRNSMRFWSFLMALDSSISQTAVDAWNTPHNLPADFDEMYKVFGGAGGRNEYFPVPFESMLSFISAANRYSIDFGNAQIRFTGPAAQTIYLWYKKLPTSLIGLSDAQKAATTTILWPKRFCPLLAYDMAESFLGGIDADMVSRPMAQALGAQKTALENAMISWDARNRMKLFDNSASPQRFGSTLTPADVIDFPRD